LKLKDGTTNFLNTARSCDQQRGIGPSPLSPLPPYTEARHRALIAVHLSARKRPFHSVEDPEYGKELRLVSQNRSLRTPSQETVRDDVERLYEGFAPRLTAYFEV
ncbi:hypothetical protein C8Q73DRAFT_625428, partial [Cubamyces lactineus]